MSLRDTADALDVDTADSGSSTRGYVTPITLNRDIFMRQLIASLGHLNEGVLGSDVASAYIMNVGLSMGAAIEAEYKRFWGIERAFTLDEYAHVIIDLKQKIQGNFSLVSKSPEKVVVQTTSCPFDEFVRQSPSLCFMTSSVFGGIAARNFGYAKVALQKRIALGDPGCYVTVYLQHTAEAEAAIGKVYFPEVERASPDIAQQLRLMENVRRLQRELGELHSRWEEVVRGAADAIVLTDPDGFVAYANARWRDVLGVEGEELGGGSLQRVVVPDDQVRLDKAREQAIVAGQRVMSLPLRLYHRDGSTRHVIVSLGPVHDERGGIVGMLAIAHDVTEEREAERLKSDFLHTASHELRTPVTTIRTFTDILLRTLERDGSIDPEQLAKRLRTIQRQTDRLVAVSTDLLDVSRAQQGKLVVQRQRQDLRTLVADCVEIQREALPANDTHALRLCQPGEPVLVEVERSRIEQIMANLLENAIKYSPDGGEILVAVEEDGARTHVRVTDHGIGIPADDLAKLFTPFYRGSNASSRNFIGLGLGLYLCRTVAEAHGGMLSVASVAGEGATFTLTLPRASGLTVAQESQGD